MNRLQPGRPTVAWRERHSSAEMRPQPRPRQLSASRVEENLLALARRRRLVVHPFVRRFRLTQRFHSVPSPVIDCRVVGQGLFLLRVLVPRLALRRYLHLHPILDGDLGWVGFPIGLVLGDLEFLTTVPIDHRPHELITCDTGPHTADTVGQFNQRLHHIRLKPGRLQGVVHPPESPHARHVVLRNVAMEYEFSGQRLQSSRTALDHLIINLRRPNGLHVETIRGVANERELHRTITGSSKIQVAVPGLTCPANGPAMEVMRMHDL